MVVLVLVMRKVVRRMPLTCHISTHSATLHSTTLRPASHSRVWCRSSFPPLYSSPPTELPTPRLPTPDPPTHRQRTCSPLPTSLPFLTSVYPHITPAPPLDHASPLTHLFRVSRQWNRHACRVAGCFLRTDGRGLGWSQSRDGSRCYGNSSTGTGRRV